MKKILVGFMLFFGSISYGQSVTGTSGLIHIPSARMLEDGQLVLGAGYIPKPYFQRFGRSINPGLNTYITYGILPFVEVMFRYSHELNMPVNARTQYFPDRMFTLRVRLVNENKIVPALVFGLQDASLILGNTDLIATNYSATYFVSSKNFKFNFGNIDVSIGYSFDFLQLKSKDYLGFFGGLSFIPNFYKKISISLEHDSKGINSGLKWNPFKPINLMIGVWDLKKPTFSFNYIF